jgi:hypothetical protein
MLGNKKLLEALDIIALAGEIDGPRRRLGLLGGWRRSTRVLVPRIAADSVGHVNILDPIALIRIVVGISLGEFSLKAQVSGFVAKR